MEGVGVMALEFRSQMDDAWYDARIVMDGYDCLRVKFVGFPDDQDEVFDANNLTSFKDIAEFRRRFRPMSVQIQDNECSQVTKGTLVCVAHAICPDDRRFYDAVVYKVSFPPSLSSLPFSLPISLSHSGHFRL